MSESTPYRPRDPGEPFEHYALLYNGQEDYLGGTVPFILDALAADEPVLVAVPPDNLALISGALGPAASRVRFVNMTEAGRNPGRIIPGVLSAFVNEHDPVPFRIVGEPVWAARGDEEYVACVHHESLINLALAGRKGTVLCPYDGGSLDRARMVDAERTHPELIRAGLTWPSYRYQEPADLVPRITALPEPPAHAAELVFCAGVRSVREFCREQAALVGLPADRVDDLLLAVNEIATNTVLHSGGAGAVRVWSEPTHLVCEVRDRGYLADPLAGRLPPAADSPHGRGLILVNAICDLVRVDTHPGGTTVRMWFRR
jgi:anti-sigma regulatory factor (Ser/Thr protein kinase)